MTAQVILHRYFPAFYLVLIAILGCSGGWLTAVIVEIWLTPSVTAVDPGSAGEAVAARKRPLSDFQVIPDRNIFDARQQAAAVLAESKSVIAGPDSAGEKSGGEKPPAASRKDITLVGTVAAGPDSLAVIRQGAETRVYRLGEEVAGARIEEISRHEIILLHGDSTRERIGMLFEPVVPGVMKPVSAPSRTTAASGKRFDIQQVGENRWLIPREAADQARSNLNELLKQARLEPRIVADQTDGFVVRMIRPGSFLAMLGLRLGDVVMEINNVQLNSPEQALQIFQQLREARSIKMAVLRDDTPMVYEYEIN